MPDSATSPRPNPTWMLLVVLVGVVLVLFVTAWWWPRPAGRDEWRREEIPCETSDFRGNIALIDEKDDSVSILATSFAGWGYRSTFTRDKFVVVVGEPQQSLSIARASRTLTIRLPDGTEERFPLPAGFASQLRNGFDRVGDSLLRRALALYTLPADHARLEQFLSRYQEPANPLTRPTTVHSEQ